MSKEISVYVIITIAFLALLSSLSPAFLARAQTQTTSSNSTIVSSSIFSSTPISSTNTISAIDATITQNATTSSTQTPASITVSTTTNSTSTGTVTNSTQATSSTAVSTTISLTTTTSEITSSAQSTTSSSSYISPSTTNSTLVSSSTTTSLTSTSDSSTTSISASTTSSSTSTSSSDPGSAGYSISFSPTYWLCNDVSVTFTGPLVESGLYGDTLQFQYFQYSTSYPSVLNPIFTDPGLTVTSDTVNYWINYNEYAPVNFAYMPNIAVKVVDVTPKSNGYMSGQIFMELTNLTPEGYQYCQIASPAPIPEFQAEWMIIMITVALGLAFLQAHNHRGRLTKKSTNVK